MQKQTTIAAAALALLATAIGAPADLGPVHPLGGPFEASGVTRAPGGGGLLFVDDRRPDGVLWMELAQDGSPAGKPVAVPLGLAVDDPEGITTDGTYVYVVGSQSRGDAHGAGLVRFRYDAGSHAAREVQAIEGLRSLLASAVPGSHEGSRKDALNIEGLAWDAKGRRLLLGLRAPLDAQQRALVVPVKLRQARGPWAASNLEVGAPIAVALDGQGVRGLEADGDGQFLLVAGGVEGAGASRLLRWDGRSATASPVATFPKELKPEGAARTKVGGRDRTLVICDTSRYVLID
jgi:hypothetical protein